MSLKMSKQEREELLSVWREKYASLVSRYEKVRIERIIQETLRTHEATETAKREAVF